MPTMQANGTDLLKAIQQLGPDEFDALLEQALTLRRRTNAVTLSVKESRLIELINRGLPEKISHRHSELAQKRDQKLLTGKEHTELLKLTDAVERRDGERAAALLALAKLRRVPVRTLMRQMGIKRLHSSTTVNVGKMNGCQ
jgi:hypothetical protein